MAAAAQTTKAAGPLPLFAHARVKLSCATAARPETVYGGGNFRQEEGRSLLKAPITLTLLLVTQVYQTQLFQMCPPILLTPSLFPLGAVAVQPCLLGQQSSILPALLGKLGLPPNITR